MPRIKGRKLKIQTPEELLNGAYQYFAWADKKPWYRKEAIKGGDLAGKIISIPTQRPYTLKQLCIHIGISLNTFKNYEKRDAFLTVVSRVREIIETQQFEGAVVGAFNANIIARKLGLSEKTKLVDKDLRLNIITESDNESI